MTQKIRATILPGLFGVSKDIPTTYSKKWNAPSQTVTLVKRENGFTYESREIYTLLNLKLLRTEKLHLKSMTHTI